MKVINQFLILCLVLTSAYGCSTVGNNQDLATLNHYASTENYGSLVIVVDDDIAGSSRATSFIQQAENYAQIMGISLVDDAGYQSADSKIVLSLDEDGRYPVRLYRKGAKLDEFYLNQLDQQSAQTMVDEMLLLWYPPGLIKPQRKPVPENVLMPTFYEVSSKPNDYNIGWQKNYQLETARPLFQWESFPRAWDVPEGMSSDDFSNIRYEFKVVGGEHAENLTVPEYQLNQPLAYCQKAQWTVRVLFELNGSPRMSEWSGAYTVMPFSHHPKQWNARRNVEQSVMIVYSDERFYYFTVQAPVSPFADSCKE